MRINPLRWIRAHPWATAAMALPFVMVADYNLASWADTRIRARDADFHERYRPGIIDWNGPYEQHCQYDFEMLIYIYRTCFYVPLKENRALFTYWRPFPLFFRLAWGIVDHYYSAIELSIPLFVMYKGGEVQRLPYYGEK